MQAAVSSNTLLILIALVIQNVACDYDKNPSVIIVGAGAAGIAAAAKLYENGVTNVTILEAENRIGGRVYSIKFADAIVELGAQHCHGEKNNIVYELAKDYDLLEPDKLKFKFYYSSPVDVDESFSGNLFQVFSDIYHEGEEHVNDTISAGEYLLERCSKAITTKYGNNTENLKHAKEFLDFYLHFLTIYDSPFSIFDLSLPTYYERCEGNYFLGWKTGGYRTILDILMKIYPNPDERIPIEENILLNKEVTKIIWENRNNNDSCQVIVRCSDQSSYAADYVIFTPSLGVLKHTHEKLFLPHLPENKIRAINKLGMGAISKIFMHFPERWWPLNNFTNFFLVWTEENKQSLSKEFPFGPIKNGKSWLLNVVGFFSIDEKNPNVLLAVLGGEFVPEIEQLQDDVVVDGFTHLLKRFIGERYPNITKPDTILRNNWYTNPHFRGTYSYETVDSRKEGTPQAAILGQPLTSSCGENVLFAGEATHPTYFSTVHSAIDTGFREARRLINNYDTKEKKNPIERILNSVI